MCTTHYSPFFTLQKFQQHGFRQVIHHKTSVSFTHSHSARPVELDLYNAVWGKLWHNVLKPSKDNRILNGTVGRDTWDGTPDARFRGTEDVWRKDLEETRAPVEEGEGRVTELVLR